MPITKSAKKALRGSQRKNVINSRVRSQLKTAIDAVKTSPTSEVLAQAYSKIDRAAKQNVIHSNKAARLKSQMSKTVKSA